MFVTTLLPLPPPSSSLLPTLSQHSTEPVQQSYLHHPQSRRKPTNRLSTPLTALSQDERAIASRKLAIAMYGYSWLKPAGCNKTMLGRREEELEREEVERQLREVELQERMAIEQEEQERQEELRRQAERGEVEGVGERDLDDEVPEAEEAEGSGEEDEVAEEEEGDLDDDIPEAEAHESSWVYDTRREPDTESEEEDSVHEAQLRRPKPQARRPIQPSGIELDDSVATEAIVNALYNQDELGEYEHQHDLDDDIPDMDGDIDMDMDMDANLSDEVPSAIDSPGWEHTDSELEESEMDISLLPPHPSARSRNPGTTHEEMRRVSGNQMLPPALPPVGLSRSSARQGLDQQQPQQPQPPRTAPRRNLRTMMRTPATADDISALISTGGTSALDTGHVTAAVVAAEDSAEPQSPNRRSWLNPAGARRNLFGGFRGGVTSAVGGARARPQQATRPTGTGTSSGGLFTPSPRLVPPGNEEDSDEEERNDRVPEEPRSRTRSGRLLGGLQAVRRTGRRRDGET